MFIPRHPVVEDQFCQLNATTSGGATAGAGGVLAYAGSACYLDTTQTEAYVNIYYGNEAFSTFGFLMQKVKVGYHSIHPAGFVMPGDLGSSDVIAQPSYNANGVINGAKAAPVGVAHLGIWDTIHYYAEAVINAGTALGVRRDASSELSTVYLNTTAGTVARVVKGASAAQVTANVANTTLFPIRVKLLV